MKICILNIATNKYIQFVEQLLNSVEENFLNGHEISALVFTNHEVEEISENVKISQIEHEPWPIPTLKRYHYFVKEGEYISQFDYCFYMDVDMRIEDKVGDEVFGDLVATQHPGFWFKTPNQFSYERREQSTAYVPYNEGRMYYAGGFNGGKPEHFLRMSQTIVAGTGIAVQFRTDARRWLAVLRSTLHDALKKRVTEMIEIACDPTPRDLLGTAPRALRVC